MTDLKQRKQEVKSVLDESGKQRLALEEKLNAVEDQLRELLKDKPYHDQLAVILPGLKRMIAEGRGELFWGDNYDKEQAQDQLTRSSSLEGAFRDKYSGLVDQRVSLWNQLEEVKDTLHEYGELSAILAEIEEDAKHDFVIERESNVPLYRASVMPWSIQGEDEKRFRKILAMVLLAALILGYLVPLWELPELEREVKIEVPERLAQLLLEKQQAPPPPPPVEEELPPDEEKPDEEETPAEESTPEPEKQEAPPEPQQQVAKRKAESAGVLAFKSDFSGLLDLDKDVAKKLGTVAKLSNSGQTAKQATRSLITSQATSGTGGINTGSISRNVGSGSGSAIEGVAITRVESGIGTGYATEDRPLSSGPGPSRTDEEIQIVFDKYKAALYRIYNRELRKNPTLQGKMVLRLTIQPDGSVSACSVDSSDMDSPSLNENIVNRVKRFNFGAKEGVPAITILFPVDFLPAS